MDYFCLIAVKKCQHFSSTKGNLHTNRPCKWLRVRTPCSNNIQVSILHFIQNQKYLISLLMVLLSLKDQIIKWLKSKESSFLTSKQMIIQASTRYEFINQKPFVILRAITYQLHKIWVTQPSKVVNFCLQFKRHRKVNNIC